MPVGVVVFNHKKDKFVYANDYFLHAIGIELKDLTRGDWLRFVDQSAREETRETADKAWGKGYLGLFRNRWINQKTGESIPLVWTAYKITKLNSLSYVQFDNTTLYDWLNKK